ncbi:RNase P modulator RnpM [Macrococcus armenti]|uniref:RNase P modulator RnpM n=1 Tax=Macrococcus armenti TaxID=2875764 RepID=UPI001CCA4C54|nr:YlxR family protein [Macrococcus armenti]UBH09563.1 YlxR family protein [Macrococcus armenti]UBH11839.1 YlxR family protein [Macrococcus armenti]UBH14056.1 YlxR family protein [Macrococcus armenti]UBH16316.1 YlxR family protein [Macrococcus armenti]UBH18673.1 YlxR family protein [Macrococcus armenti]
MKQRKIPMRKCILSNEMKPKQEMVRVVKNKEGEIFADATGKQNGRGAYVSMDLEIVNKAREKKKLEQYFEADTETLNPVYDEIIRLIYREMIPKR